MKRTTRKPNAPKPNTFHTEQADLGLATLIAEYDGGRYQPIAPVSTIREAREMARDDFRRKSGRAGTELPLAYKVWAYGRDGFTVTAQFDASQV